MTEYYIEPKKPLIEIVLKDGSQGRIEAFKLLPSGSLSLLISLKNVPFFGWVDPKTLKPA